MVVSLSNSFARVVKLVYTYALGAYAFGRGGSSPLSRTKSRISPVGAFLYAFNLTNCSRYDILKP